MTGNRRGFTFIEMLVVMIVLGVLASLAVLKYIDLRHRAISVQAMTDLNAVRLAAYGAYYETGSWPADAAPGVVPPGLIPYLAGGLSFDKPEYTLDWENLAPPGGGPSDGMQVGVVVTTQSASLRRTLITSLGDKGPFFVVGGDLTFVIVGADGRS